jgi:Trypsin-like peptidase domain
MSRAPWHPELPVVRNCGALVRLLALHFLPGIWHCREYVLDAPMIRRSSIMLLACAALLLPGSVDAADARRQTGQPPAKSLRRITGTGETLALPKFAKRHGYSAEQMRGRLGATGRLSCPWGTATAFLIGESDLFVTSAHVFVDLDPANPRSAKGRGKAAKRGAKPSLGASMGDAGRCKLTFLLGQGRYRIAKGSLRIGTNLFTEGIHKPWLDWAVGRLDRPVQGVTPYGIGTAPLSPGAPLVSISQGMGDFIPRVCSGKLLDVAGYRAPVSFTTSCDVGLGASGGPVLAATPSERDGAQWFAVGLTKGWIDESGEGRGRHHLALPLSQALTATIAQSLRDKSKVIAVAQRYAVRGDAPELTLALYRIAALAEDPEAYLQLGLLHATAAGTKTAGTAAAEAERIEAVAWLSLAAQKLPTDAFTKTTAPKLLGQLRAGMTPDQLALALGRAKTLPGALPPNAGAAGWQ